jgi:hypothetical protein
MRNPNPIPNPVAEILQSNTVLAVKNVVDGGNREQMSPYANCAGAVRQNDVVPAKQRGRLIRGAARAVRLPLGGGLIRFFLSRQQKLAQCPECMRTYTLTML